MKRKIYPVRRLLAALITATLTFGTVGAVPVFAAQTVYEQKTQESITRGVTYEHNSRMTTDGIQDIYVLTVDLTESTLELKEVESKTEYGLKETVQKMLTDNGAVAGVNCDFFGMAGSYSAGFGPVVRDGELISAGTSVNQEKDQYAAYVLDENGNSVFTYFKTNATFTNGTQTMELASINKVTSMVFPIYFDQQAASSTADLDARFENLVKFVIQNGVITYISQPGETVQVPNNGYLIVMSADYRNNAASQYQVGNAAALQVTSTIDFDQIDTAFGGGGQLLTKGQEAAATDIVAAGRQPRTAFGVSQDGTKAILMVVDGRGDSIGATHGEMAALMLEYGAYEAMHLDGGGSSTMAVKTVDDTAPQVQNTVSDGAERKVISSLGIFQTAPQGEITEIGMTVVNAHTQPGKTAEFTVYGLDEYQNRIYIAPEEVTFEVVGVEGTWNGYEFLPATTGAYSVVATYGEGFTAEYALRGRAFCMSIDTGKTDWSREFKIVFHGGESSLSYRPEDQLVIFTRKNWVTEKPESKECRINGFKNAEIWADRSSMEIFINSGKTVFTSRVWTEESAPKIEISGIPEEMQIEVHEIDKEIL